jgi:hypothetical protein
MHRINLKIYFIYRSKEKLNFLEIFKIYWMFKFFMKMTYIFFYLDMDLF